MEPPAAVYAGPVWDEGRFRDGWITVEGGRVVARGAGDPPSRPAARGVVVPAPVNAHTHVGDALARGRIRPGMSLADLVAPPDGLKHRILRESPAAEIEAGIRGALTEMAAVATGAFIDFREGGLAGVRLLRAASAGAAPRAIVLARPSRHGTADPEELDALLDVADGLGLSALRDSPPGHARTLSSAARARGKLFALHLSEAERESADAALDLDPDFVVHLVHATSADFAAVAAEGVPIVACPRSNAYFGKLPDLEGMLEAGATLALGTDNAMLQEADVLAEARFAAERFPGIPRERLLDAVVSGGRAALRRLRGLDPRDPFALGYLVLRPQGGDPLASLFGPDPPVPLAGATLRPIGA